MNLKVQNRFLLYERISTAIALIALIIFLASPTSIHGRSGQSLITRLAINITILLFASATALFLHNRRLKSSQPIPDQSTSLEEAFQLITPIQNQVLHRVMQVFPWILIAIVLLGITEVTHFPLLPRISQNHYFGILAVAVSLLAFQGLLKETPQTFHTLWNRTIISLPAKKFSEDSAQLDGRYKVFLDNFSKTMNSSRQLFAGVICGSLGSFWLIDSALFWFVRSINEVDPLQSRWYQFLTLSDLLLWIFTFMIGYVVGLMIWRMIVIGLTVHKLGREFDLTLQRGHPDGCEGLAPLGSLCLWNAIIISPAGIYLSARLVLVDYFQEYLYFLLIVILAIAGISFFGPLWNIHKIMVAKRDELNQQLNQLSQSINLLSRKLLDKGSDLKPSETENIEKKLDGLRKIYKDNQIIPVWPFNTGTLARFITSQTVPILSLIGLGQPIVEIIGSLMKFIAGLGSGGN